MRETAERDAHGVTMKEGDFKLAEAVVQLRFDIVPLVDGDIRKPDQH